MAHVGHLLKAALIAGDGRSSPIPRYMPNILFEQSKGLLVSGPGAAPHSNPTNWAGGGFVLDPDAQLKIRIQHWAAQVPIQTQDSPLSNPQGSAVCQTLELPHTLRLTGSWHLKEP